MPDKRFWPSLADLCSVLGASCWAHLSHVPVCWIDPEWSDAMNPVSRRPVNKSYSAKKFRKNTTRTKAANMQGPMRGGIRL